MDPIKLTVTKAYPADSGKGITRLDPTTIQQLQISVGDVIIMEGKKKRLQKSGEQNDRTGIRVLSGSMGLHDKMPV